MSSAVSLSAARETFPSTPILGVIEAGVRALIKTNPAGSVGVLATSGTVKARAYTRTIRSAAPNIEVYEQACPLFVPLVEEGIWDTAEAVNVAREYAAPLYEKGCRTFILGCTHYPYLADTIRRAVGEDITLIDPAEETAQEAANILLTTGRLNPDHVEPTYTFLTSADTDRFAELGGKFLGRKIDAVERINWGIDLRKIECKEKTVDKMVKSAL
jgi:glutamate racemase